VKQSNVRRHTSKTSGLKTHSCVRVNPSYINSKANARVLKDFGHMFYVMVGFQRAQHAAPLRGLGAFAAGEFAKSA
jgi:hypothetical protein